MHPTILCLNELVPAVTTDVSRSIYSLGECMNSVLVDIQNLELRITACTDRCFASPAAHLDRRRSYGPPPIEPPPLPPVSVLDDCVSADIMGVSQHLARFEDCMAQFLEFIDTEYDMAVEISDDCPLTDNGCFIELSLHVALEVLTEFDSFFEPTLVNEVFEFG